MRAEEFLAEVIAVTDGDTVVVLRDDKRIRVRLADIDAPEGGQAYGPASRQALLELALHKQVQVHGLATDGYRRLVGRVSAGDLNINQELVRRGMAWYYSRYRNDETLKTLQNEARQAKRGLWVQDNPMPPWQWRKANRQPRTAAKSYTCGSKFRCAEMSACEEARYYLSTCQISSLDGDGDGIPCEQLCMEEHAINSKSGGAHSDAANAER